MLTLQRRSSLFSPNFDGFLHQAGSTVTLALRDRFAHICTAWLSAGHRITFSSLSPPPSELVEVSSSVPVALVIMIVPN